MPRAPDITYDFWLDPEGRVHQLDDEFQEHHTWAQKYLRRIKEKQVGFADDQLYAKGWQRGVFHDGSKKIWVNGYNPLTSAQRATMEAFGIENDYTVTHVTEQRYTARGVKETVVYEPHVSESATRRVIDRLFEAALESGLMAPDGTFHATDGLTHGQLAFEVENRPVSTGPRSDKEMLNARPWLRLDHDNDNGDDKFYNALYRLLDQGWVRVEYENYGGQRILWSECKMLNNRQRKILMTMAEDNEVRLVQDASMWSGGKTVTLYDPEVHS